MVYTYMSHDKVMVYTVDYASDSMKWIEEPIAEGVDADELQRELVLALEVESML